MSCELSSREPGVGVPDKVATGSLCGEVDFCLGGAFLLLFLECPSRFAFWLAGGRRCRFDDILQGVSLASPKWLDR